MGNPGAGSAQLMPVISKIRAGGKRWCRVIPADAAGIAEPIKLGQLDHHFGPGALRPCRGLPPARAGSLVTSCEVETEGGHHGGIPSS